MAICRVEVWIVVDANGDSAVGNSREDAIERYESEINALADCGGYRIIHLPVSVPQPEEQQMPEVVIPPVNDATV